MAYSKGERGQWIELQGVNAPSGFIELTVGADTPPRAIDQDRVGVVDVGWRIVSAE